VSKYNLNFELVDEEDCYYFHATKKHVVQARGGDIFDVYRKKRVLENFETLYSVFLMIFFLYAIVRDLEFRRKILFVQRQVLLFGLSGFIIHVIIIFFFFYVFPPLNALEFLLC